MFPVNCDRVTEPLCCSVVISSRHGRMHYLLGMGGEPSGCIVARKRSVNARFARRILALIWF
jgi:hypothetical protein